MGSAPSGRLNNAEAMSVAVKFTVLQHKKNFIIIYRTLLLDHPTQDYADRAGQALCTDAHGNWHSPDGLMLA